MSPARAYLVPFVRLPKDKNQTGGGDKRRGSFTSITDEFYKPTYLKFRRKGGDDSSYLHPVFQKIFVDLFVTRKRSELHRQIMLSKKNMNFQTFSTIHHCSKPVDLPTLNYTNISAYVFKAPLRIIKYILHIPPYRFLLILIFFGPPRVQSCGWIVSFSSAFIMFVVSKANI